MKLIICSRDIDSTLHKGDLIAWLNDDEFEGKEVGLFNALTYGKTTDSGQWLAQSPFSIITAPLITYNDILPILNDVVVLGEDGADGNVRKWKIDDSNVEQRAVGTFTPGDLDPTNLRWSSFFQTVRRDTYRAYREITRNDLTINDLIAAR